MVLGCTGFARVKKVTITSVILSGPARHVSSRKSSQKKAERCCEKSRVFENLAHIAATNKETDLVISLYDELIDLVSEFLFPKGPGHIGCFTENQLKSCFPDVKKKIH